MRRLLPILFLTCVIRVFGGAHTHSREPVYMPLSDAQPSVQAMGNELPPDLRKQPANQMLRVWQTWVKHRDSEIRARLAQGEEDTLINFMLFGTSFTRQPRVTPESWQQMRQQQEKSSVEPQLGSPMEEAVAARIGDLVRAAASPGANERWRFANVVLTRKGYNLITAGGRAKAAKFLAAGLSRVLREGASYASVLQQARSLGNPTEEFARRSTLFRARGLSLDTSWKADFALEESLAALKEKGLIGPGSMTRVAIVGPGLDFTDKQVGYDFYPQQTIQPFALFDTLVRLGLAKARSLMITTLDISERVNEHLGHAKQRARQGSGYVVQLPLDPDTKWTPEAIRYWEHLGDEIGTPVAPAAVPAVLAGVKVRAVRIQPAIVNRVTPVDLNIVLQRLDLHFDLVVATNIFVYYDTFEQTLALANVTHMLKPGGFLLSNNALLELPSSATRSVGYKTTVYSDRRNDGDQIVWYRRSLD